MDLKDVASPAAGFFENLRRRLVRVLKLHRGFILTKKADINPPKDSETPPWPPGGGAFFLLLFSSSCFFENLKRCPRVQKLRI